LLASAIAGTIGYVLLKKATKKMKA